jgi:hypothetical protein
MLGPLEQQKTQLKATLVSAVGALEKSEIFNELGNQPPQLLV